MRVLLVEDNAALAAVLRFNLERLPAEVTWASDGEEARALLNQEAYDVLITDYQLPHASGREVIEAARSSAINKGCPVILLTAKALELDGDRIKEELQVEEVISKPFSPRAIVHMVGALAKHMSSLGSDAHAG